MTMLLSDYCFEINTRGIKKNYAIQTIGLIAAVLHSPRIGIFQKKKKYEDDAEDLRASRRQNWKGFPHAE